MLDEDKVILTQPDMEAQIAVAMAGIAAEQMVFGSPSTGSELDLERATDTAWDMAGRFGMSQRIGRARILRDRGEVFLGRDYLAADDASQPTLEHLDLEVRRILYEQETLARTVLEHNRPVLDALAHTLSQRETVEGGDLLAHLRGVPPSGRPPPRSATAVPLQPRRTPAVPPG